jgi:tripartite-type tricarboxylate transporter receptor subunit TctC
MARLVAIALGLLTWVAAASAQSWPTAPVTLVVPFAAGGPSDVVGRIMATRLSEILGQQVVIENVAGAGGMIAGERVAQADPDGYQVLLGTVGTQAYNQTLFKHPRYNAATDFAPVVLIAEQPLVLVVNNELGVETLQEFIAYAREHQGDLAFGSGGAGSSTHLGCVMLNSAIGVRVQHIPYRGSALAMQDVISGHIEYLCDAVATALPQVRAQAVKAIAVLARTRSPVLAEVPTAQEQGLLDFEASNWLGLFLPRATPAAIVSRLNGAAIEAMNTPSVMKDMQALGTDLVTPDRRTPDYLGRFVVSEIEKWSRPIKASGVAVD